MFSKDRIKYKHKHDLVYHAKWPECNEDCIGEIGRRLQDHVDEHAGKDSESNLLLTFISG